MNTDTKVLGIIMIALAILPAFAGITSAALPVAITGYVGVNNTPGSPMAAALSGWTVSLKKSPYTSTSATATTSSTGAYSLSVTSSMGTGTYRVYETIATGYKNYTLSYAEFSITTSTGAQKANFTNYQLPSVILTGHKYLDPNGTHTSTATPLSGWTIQLNQSAGTAWSVLATTTTNASGVYQFQVTDVGSYRVNEVEQANYKKTWPATNYSQTIKGGQTGTITQDFWNAKVMNVKISGHKYEDTDGTHTLTATPLAGWKIHLQNLSGSTWNEVANLSTATTTGYYEFASIRVPGSYRVIEDQQAGYQSNYPLGGTASFTLDANSANQTADFWNYKVPAVAVSGHSFLDTDGTHTSKATGLGSFRVHLQNLSGSTWSEVASNTTAAGTGYYEFPSVRVPGSYQVIEDSLSGYTQSYPAAPYAIAVKSGQTTAVPNEDFWSTKLMSVNVTGYLYSDPDLTHSSTATPLKNWVMHLSILSGSPAAWSDVATMKTGKDGSYAFLSITQPGHYKVWGDPDPSYKPSYPANGTLEFDLSAASPNLVANFWDYQLPNVAVWGYVYQDPDGTHTSTATPLEGWVIKLQVAQGSPVTWVDVNSTTTEKHGYYQFSPVSDAGTYRLAEVLQVGYAQTYPLSTGTIVITPGEAATIGDQDFWDKYNLVGTPDPTPVPVPEFPTVAVSAFTVIGMAAAVLVIRRRESR